jgi:hypothetical protein
VLQSAASDHVIHASNISLAGFTTGASPNRNLADFFQVAIDPQGMAMIAWADDSSDFAGHTYVAHQIAGYNLNTGTSLRIKGTNAPTPVATKAPQVFDFRHDARVFSPPPVTPDVDSPADILTIGYGCQLMNGATWITATMTTSGLDTVPPLGLWRMNFSTNPTRPGASDRADQWYLEADTDAEGTRNYVWGATVRNSDGSLTYTPKGPADAGSFNLTARSVTVKVDTAKLNAVQTRGLIKSGTVLIGLRGSATDARTAASSAAVGLSDSTRSGGTFTMGSCQP